MLNAYERAVLDAVKRHPGIERAAITGSKARALTADEFSDLDLLLIARDVNAVRNVRAWLPQSNDILVCAFHLDHYCTVLLKSLVKLDLAIFAANDPVTEWIVQDYEVFKGDDSFRAQLSVAANDARLKKSGASKSRHLA